MLIHKIIFPILLIILLASCSPSNTFVTKVNGREERVLYCREITMHVVEVGQDKRDGKWHVVFQDSRGQIKTYVEYNSKPSYIAGMILPFQVIH